MGKRTDYEEYEITNFGGKPWEAKSDFSEANPVDRIVSKTGSSNMDMSSKIDNKTMFDAKAQSIDKMGSINMSEKIRRMLE